jgi:uncharacterized repeat protein (TIGR01451 family)
MAGRTISVVLVGCGMLVAGCWDSTEPPSAPVAAPVHVALNAGATSLIGPVYPPPGGATLTATGDPGRTGGKTWQFTSIQNSLFDALAWGPASGDTPTLALDGVVDGTTETLAFDEASSDLPNGIQVWTGSSSVSTLTGLVSVSTRIRIVITKPDASAVGLIAATDPMAVEFGVPGDVGAVAPVEGPAFNVNFTFEGRIGGVGSWIPILNLYDGLATPAGAAGQVLSSFTGGFYYVLAAAPIATPSTTLLEFGTVGLGSTANLTFDISNTGNADLVISSSGIIGGGASDFDAAGECIGATVAPGASCEVSVNFHPGVEGPRLAQLTVVNNANPVAVVLSGSGILIMPAVSLNPTALSFGTQAVGTTSAAQTVTMNNTGNGNLIVAAVSPTGGNPGDFNVNAAGCTAAAVIPGGSCNISVTFAPAATGARSSSLIIIDNAAGGGQAVPLSGTGIVSADLAVSVGADPNPAHAGKKLTYTINLRNNGPGSAAGISLTDVIPSSTTFASVTAPAGVSCTTPAPSSTGTMVCAAATMSNNQSFVVTLVVNALSGGKASISNTVAVTSASGDPVSANNTATLNTSVYGRK